MRLGDTHKGIKGLWPGLGRRLLPLLGLLAALFLVNAAAVQSQTTTGLPVLDTMIRGFTDNARPLMFASEIAVEEPCPTNDYTFSGLCEVLGGKITGPANPAAALPLLLNPTDTSEWITARLDNAGLGDDAVHARNILDGVIVPGHLDTRITTAQWRAVLGFPVGGAGSGGGLPSGANDDNWLRWKDGSPEWADLPQANSAQAGLQSSAQHDKVAALPEQGTGNANKIIGFNASGNYAAVTAGSGGSGGDITGVTAGAGLQGGGDNGNVTLRVDNSLAKISGDYESGGWTDSSDVQVSVRLTTARNLNQAVTLAYAADQQFQSPNADGGWRVVRVPLGKDDRVADGGIRLVGDEDVDNSLEEAAQHILLNDVTVTRLGVDSSYAYYQVPLGTGGPNITGFGGSVSLVHYRAQEDEPSHWDITVDADDIVGRGITPDNLEGLEGAAAGSFISTAPGDEFTVQRVPGLRLLRSGSAAIPFTTLSGPPVESAPAITFDDPLDWDVVLGDGQFEVYADYSFVAENPESIQFDTDSDAASGYGIADFEELRGDPVYSALTGSYKGRPLAVAHIENPAGTNAGFVRYMSRHGEDNSEYGVFQLVKNPAYNGGSASGSIRITYRIYATVQGGTTPEGNVAGYNVYPTVAARPAATGLPDNTIAFVIDPPSVAVKRTDYTVGTGADLLLHGIRVNPTRELATRTVGSQTLLYMAAASFTWNGHTVPAGGSVPSWPSGAILVIAFNTADNSAGTIAVQYPTARTATAASHITVTAAHRRIFLLNRASSTRWQITGLTASSRSDILAGDLVLTSTGTGATGVIERWDRVDGAPMLTMPNWTGSPSLTLTGNGLTSWFNLQTLNLGSGSHIIWLDMHLTIGGAGRQTQGVAFGAFEFRLVKDGTAEWTAPGHERINLRGNIGERAIKELAMISGSGAYTLQVRMSTDAYLNINPITWTAANQSILIMTFGG